MGVDVPFLLSLWVLPLVIERVDSEEQINGFLPVLDAMLQGGLATLERMRVID